MVVPSDSRPTTPCTHCKRAVPTTNLDLHIAYCVRNLERCNVCDKMIPKNSKEEHYQDTHAPVSCTLCGETIERGQMSQHANEKCSHRLVPCLYCEYPVPRVDLESHVEFCGNRTEYCYHCDKYVRLCQMSTHVHDVNVDGSRASSSSIDQEDIIDDASSGGREDNREDKEDDNHDSNLDSGSSSGSHKCLWGKGRILVAVVTGVAVILGSVLFQRRSSVGMFPSIFKKQS
eukprot:TRINITY_DN4756_c0_g1_i2.p1 TRINITY_DN4756_c0_g1~~TRINITY_DN4756_c0_g1_i2.p1  ORF type:complete len:231 (-),score=33.06 TRINITY_DN4756_c0_g1_i2:136-828(-)